MTEELTIATAGSISKSRILAATSWIRDLVMLEEARSTQEIAAAWATSLSKPALVLAEHQSKGRGGGNARWVDLAGSDILCSVVLGPIDLVRTHLAAGRALQALLREHGLQPELDSGLIRLGSLKVGGVLSGCSRDRLAVIAGFGVHVNEPASFFETGRIDETSLAAEAGHHFDRTELLIGLLSHFRAQCDDDNTISKIQAGAA